jgi:predicted SprT family Zn-dependent metalloprotease
VRKISKRKARALRRINYDLFQRVHSKPDAEALIAPVPSLADEKDAFLPSISELYRLFDRFNHEYFEGRLPRIRISYSDRMLIAGSYNPENSEIKIGKKYHRIFSDEIEDTLKHEMIHIICDRHDHRFRDFAGKMGASVKARTHISLRGYYKYLYICPACEREYPRRKRLRMAFCGTCVRTGGFDSRYKLKLVESRKKS